MDSGFPITMLRPITAARFPSIEMLFAFSISITASAVQGAKPEGSPENTFAMFTGEIPSRSFAPEAGAEAKCPQHPDPY